MAAILDLPNMAARVVGPLGSTLDGFLYINSYLHAKFGTFPTICTIVMLILFTNNKMIITLCASTQIPFDALQL